MGHHHGHEHNHHDHSHGDADNSIGIAFFLNFSFTIIEIVGACWTNSVAILSDAVHDLGDTFTLGASWGFEKLANRGRTDRLTFGHGRYSLLGAFVSSVVLLIGSAFVLVESIPRIFHPEPVQSGGMLAMAIFGVVINGIAVFRMKGGRKLNERVVMLHLLEDALGWVAVLVVALILQFVDLPVLDPLLSVAITVFVLSRIYPNLKEALRIFLQYAPDDLDSLEIKRRIESRDDVEGVHDIHLWSLEGNYHIFSAHVVLKKDIPISLAGRIRKEIEEELRRVGIRHETLEFELAGTDCSRCD